MAWIDTHCHLDAAEFDVDRSAVHAQARAAGVSHCVIPAVERSNWDTVRQLAQATGNSYALGIHPLYVARATEDDLTALAAQLQAHREDQRLVAVGEIGLDYFVPELRTGALAERQEHFYREQLKLARQHGLPVILHVRRSADRLLKHLRALAGGKPWSGIAHAFNGSEAQAGAFIQLGFKLGFGGAVTYERALQLRHLARTLPLHAVVLETDAPDIPPHWLYTTAEQRQAGVPQGRNTPAELPRIASVVAQLRGMAPEALAAATMRNARLAFPRLDALLV